MRWILLLPFLFTGPGIFGQSLPYEFQSYRAIEQTLYSDSTFHTAVKPFDVIELRKVLRDSSALTPSSAFLLKHAASSFSMLPLIEISGGLPENYRIRAGINTRVSKGIFYGSLSLLHNRADLPEFLDSITNQLRVIPGEGRFSINGSTEWRYGSGFFGIRAGKYFNLEAGYGKNFLGDGYRSVLLSDNSFNYPYARITTTFWKLKILNLYANLKDISRGHTHNKFAAAHYISWRATRRLTLGFFESVVFQSRDTSGRFALDPAYLNPVILYRPLEYSLGSADNAFFGASLRYNPVKQIFLYGQFLLDEFLLKEIKADIQALRDNSVTHGWWANKYAFQGGIRYHKAAGIKGLQLQVEYNQARPWTYTHSTYRQSYGHYNQPLAHPLGANFKEGLIMASFLRMNFYSSLTWLSSVSGESTPSYSSGKDIFLSYRERDSEHGHFTAQGVRNEISQQSVILGYFLIPRHYLSVQAELINRQQVVGGNGRHETYFVLSLRTAVPAINGDF